MSKASMVHTIFPETMFQHCQSLFAPFLCEAGLDESMFVQSDNEVPLASFVSLWELLGKKVDADVGLRMGASADHHGLGAYGHAVRSAANMRASLECMSRFIVVHSHATRLEVDFTADHVLIDYQITDPTIIHRRQDSELSISMIATNLRDITGSEIYPVRVDFEHPAPINIQTHREIFKCPVYFNQPTNRLHYTRDLLDKPICTADPRLYEALEVFLEEQRKARAAESDLLSHLSIVIAASLGSGDVSLEQVAKSQGMSARTLQRRLSEHKLEFGNLVESVRRALALEYVRCSRHNLTEVALLLGYSEASSFSRAFRRWTQLTPQQYRLSSRAS